MSSLLEAASAVPNKIEVTDKLPEHIGDVSIMTIEQAFDSLANSNIINDFNYHHDPSPNYTISKYYVYGIDGYEGEDSTVENLQAVGLSWYKQHNKPTTASQTFTSNNKTIFGGPLNYVYYGGSSRYRFGWYYSTSDYDASYGSGYWDDRVSFSVYVTVVRARE